ncbi:hypothetical protein [Streptomyces clavuligerus]|uniref:hypothetical protein n=1 Tax=Streptomyces clavuligerus TaxID=1901 RepID=UPI00017FF5CF|nr:hypothetical protein [Streptomyces clavuligerus]EDY48866.1 hypothetical protein SSCG_01894 [Streptomyces clavuligerus]MBY6307530.1 hypothetical protein [Streptomyces clavuligerus]QCS09913.1 hypothetical protein CRV15_30435 [Streptomyces clavuligerus]QPJ98041.1 hypothetical protein GE265_33995 [Streptomyces clavuligerus]WDN56620.1 hypothetical protein LL058_32890 [Streptomyces clavuligerus]
MVSYAKDERCVALAKVLVPLLERSGPESAGGYGGTFQVHVPSETAAQLGGLDLIRAALRKAARELGWTFGTYGFDGGPEGATLIGIHDKREAPEPYAKAVEEHRQRQMRAAVDRASARYSALSGPAPAPSPPLPGTPVVQTKEFLAAVADHGLLA